MKFNLKSTKFKIISIATAILITAAILLVVFINKTAPDTYPIKDVTPGNKSNVSSEITSNNSINEELPKEQPDVASSEQQSSVSSSSQASSTPPKQITSQTQPSTSVSSSQKTTSTAQPIPEPDPMKDTFIAQFNYSKQNYLSGMESELASNNAEISALREKISQVSTEHARALSQLREQCANMGMLDSGYYQSQKSNLDSTYNNRIASYQSQINELINTNADFERELNNPDIDFVLELTATRCGITHQQARDYYAKYIG